MKAPFAANAALAALLALAVFVAYQPTLANDFVPFDDVTYLLANPQAQAGLTRQSIAWAFTSSLGGNWHPLTWLSHMLDTTLFGLDPAGHHASSLILHIMNTVLVFGVLGAITGRRWPSFAVAAIFGLHPIHVESVAWVSERKDLLSCLFWLLTMAAYAHYVQTTNKKEKSWGEKLFGTAWLYKSLYRFSSVRGSKKSFSPQTPHFKNFHHFGLLLGRSGESEGQGVPRNMETRKRYALALAAFALGLMAKSMLVTLPFALLLLDYWPLGRYAHPAGTAKRFGYLFLEKTPFFVLAALFSLLALMAQRQSNAISPLEAVGLGLRLANALTSYVAYIVNMIDPRHLIALYPFPQSIPLWKTVTAAAFLGAMSLAALLARRSAPFFGVGWFWYLGTLVPVIGLVQIGVQSMADRYTYIPSIGLSIAAVWGVERLFERLPRRAALAGMLLALVLVVAMIVQTRRQVRTWKDGVALFSRALAVIPDHSIARYNLAGVLATRGDYEAALEHLRACVQSDPWDLDALKLFSQALLHTQRFEEAISVLQQVQRLAGGDGRLYADLARAYAGMRLFEPAAAAMTAALQYDPANPGYLARMAALKLELADVTAALNYFLAALARTGDSGAAAANRKLFTAMFEDRARKFEANQSPLLAQAAREAALRLEQSSP